MGAARPYRSMLRIIANEEPYTVKHTCLQITPVNDFHCSRFSTSLSASHVCSEEINRKA